MGNCCSVKGAIDHWIYIKSGDRKDSNGDVTINVILYDDRGQKTPEIQLEIDIDHEGKTTDVFQVPPQYVKKFGNVVQVEFWREPCPSPDWFCEVIMINDTRSQVKEKCYYFPVQRWALPEFHYLIRVSDTCIPAEDPYGDQRNFEIGEAKVNYEYNTDNDPGLPAQIRNLPHTEVFSDFQRFDLNREQDIMLSHHPLRRLTQPTPYPRLWSNLDDLLNVYDNEIFPKPAKAEERWSRDDMFGAQRLIGCNPAHIRLCTELPENMGVTVEMLRQPLEGWSLKQIIDAKRLYIVNHSILDDLPTKNGNPLCAPMALMFVTSKKTLVPIAIQLYQDIAPDNPVFLPNDPPFTWFLAKMWFNNADATVNLAVSHFGCVQMIMESISIALHRTLAPNHPVYRLLSPHLLYLIAANSKGLSQLIEPDGWVDQVTSIGVVGMQELIKRAIKDWRLDVQGTFPKELESRGLLDTKTLPHYAYRDDGLLLHKAIETYVRKVLKIYYTETSVLRGDEELAQFANEMALPKEQGGAGIQGIPNNGLFRHIDDLILVCTSVIFNCTVQHSAVTSPMYEEYGFPPNYPLLLHGTPPMDKEVLDEDHLVRSLPDQRRTMLTLSMTKLLSKPEEKGLGEFDFQFQYDTAALIAEKEFKADLARISEQIHQRNKDVEETSYHYLLPENIANFIHS